MYLADCGNSQGGAIRLFELSWWEAAGGPPTSTGTPPTTTSKAQALLPLDVLLRGHPKLKPVNPVALDYEACDVPMYLAIRAVHG